MDAMLHRIEALPGDSGYLVTFALIDGTQITTVLRLPAHGEQADADAGADAIEVQVAEASLPPGWTRSSETFVATVAAVRAVEVARRLRPPAQLLRDVPGGWDVALGNVVAGAPGGGIGGIGGAAGPQCIAHGEMPLVDGVHVCAECGARAVLG